MTSRAIVLPLAAFECAHLLRLLDEFRELIAADIVEDASEPALQRLTPDVYPDDVEASLAFSQATHDDLLDRRAAEASVVRDALAGHDVSAEELSERDALTTRDVVIPEAEIDAWLRTLTALRLVLAARLGIADEDIVTSDPRAGVYDWLGYRLEGLVQAADALE
ncbi:DUF2017 family protein [Microbacterium tumbae]